MRSIIASIIVAAAAMIGTAMAQSAAPVDWTSPSGLVTLSFKSMGWDLTPGGRASGSPFVLEIMAKDNSTPMFCNVAEFVGPLSTAASPQQVVLQLLEMNKVGSTIADSLGGSRVVESQIEQAGSALAHRLVIETLDEKRPVMGSTTVRFLAPQNSSLVAGQIDCVVGVSASPRAKEIETILKTVRINGIALEPK